MRLAVTTRRAFSRGIAAQWALALCLAATLPPAIAEAQSADALIEEGIAQRRAGDDAGALTTFQRAYDASPSPRAAAQLGLVHQALGQWVEAHARLEEALAVTADEWVERNRAALEQALGVVRGEVGTVEIIVSGSLPRGARASLGAREITELPMSRPIVVVAGEEALVVSAPGHGTVRRDVRVRAGQLSRVTVELRPEVIEPAATSSERSAAATTSSEPAVTRATSAPETDAAPSGSEDWIVWVIVGGAALVGVGIAVAVVASQESLEPPLPGTVGAVELLRF